MSIRPKLNHNLSNHLLYQVWKSMKQRCNNPKNRHYHNYGQRGIKVCDEWNDNFKPFYDWATTKRSKGLFLEMVKTQLKDFEYEITNNDVPCINGFLSKDFNYGFVYGVYS